MHNSDLIEWQCIIITVGLFNDYKSAHCSDWNFLSMKSNLHSTVNKLTTFYVLKSVYTGVNNNSKQ